MHQKRRYLFAIVAATAITASSATALVVGRQHNDAQAQPSPPPGTLAVLARAPGASDQVPSELLKLPVAEHFASSSAAGARHAFSDNGRDYYVIPGRSGTTCLVYTRGAGSDFESGGTCASTSLLRTGAIYMTEPEATGGLLASMLVSDGYSTATSNGIDASVRHNVVVLHGASQLVNLTGSAIGRVDLGEQAPSGDMPTKTSTTSAPTQTVSP